MRRLSEGGAGASGESRALVTTKGPVLDGEASRNDAPPSESLREYAVLRRAVRKYFRAVDDPSWGPRKDWHKRHDVNKAERALRDLVK